MYHIFWKKSKHWKFRECLRERPKDLSYESFIEEDKNNSKVHVPLFDFQRPAISKQDLIVRIQQTGFRSRGL